MVGNVADIPQDVWDAALSRLNQFGVFADEERKLPGLPRPSTWSNSINENICHRIAAALDQFVTI